MAEFTALEVGTATGEAKTVSWETIAKRNSIIEQNRPQGWPVLLFDA